MVSFRNIFPSHCVWCLVRTFPVLLPMAAVWVSPVYPDSFSEAEFSRPVRILPLGDSITQAYPDTSYRYPLWRRLLDHGVEVDFLGTRSDSRNLASPDRPENYKGRAYDGDHEGHWGWTADEVLAYLDQWLPQYDRPDIALIHLGTNDVFRGQDDYQTRQEIVQIMAKLRQRNSKMLIVVAKIFPGSWGDVRPLNAEIAQLTASGAVIADCYTGIDVAADTVDGAHPSASGGEKMAAAWWEVLESRLDPWRQTYDRWEAARGGGFPWDADSDGDGWMNFLEFAGRTDPGDPDQLPRVDWTDGQWSDPFDPLRGGERLLMETSTDLNSFAEPDGTAGSSSGSFIRWQVLSAAP